MFVVVRKLLLKGIKLKGVNFKLATRIKAANVNIVWRSSKTRMLLKCFDSLTKLISRWPSYGKVAKDFSGKRTVCGYCGLDFAQQQTLARIIWVY